MLPRGNRTNAIEQLFGSVLNTHTNTINRIYTYDSVCHLTGETISGTPGSGSASYSYDPVGNRLTRGIISLPLSAQTFTFDANDRLNTDTYDANGNTLLGSGFGQSSNDEYDFENRLITRHTSSCTVHLTYDGDGNRVSKTLTTATNSITTFYVVDELNPSGYAQMLEEHTATNSQPATINCAYTYGHTLISQDRFNGSSWVSGFYGCDGHGNVRYLTDTNAVVTDTYDYDAFGTLIAQSGTTPNNYLYCGEQFDDLDLYYNRARYLNVDSARFWSKDPFEGMYRIPLSLNSYLFGYADGINSFDPSGLTTVAETSEAQEVNIEVERNIYKRSGGQQVKRVVKRVTCWIGKEGIEEALDLTFDTETHHPINQGNFRGPDMNTVQLPFDLHRAFHSVLNLFLRSNKTFEGLGNFSSQSAWAKWTMSKSGRRLILVEIRAASQLIDKECSFKAPNSLTSYVKRNEKVWINEAPYP